MPGVDQLRPEERAVIELVLRRGQSYAQIGRALGVPEARARELAHRAVARLEPADGAPRPQQWPQLADYVLGRQDSPDARRTRATLEASAPARRWVRSVTEALRPLFGPGKEPWVPPEPAARRRREPPLAAIVALLLLLLVALAAVIALTGGGAGTGRERSSERAPSTPGGPTRVVGQVLLRGVEGGRSRGIAGVVEGGGRRRVVLQLRVPRAGAPRRYVASLADTRRSSRPLGGLRGDAAGTVLGAVALPPDAGRFRWLDIAREAPRAPGRPGRLVLRGPLPR